MDRPVSDAAPAFLGDDSMAAWPNQVESARILRVNEATLSRMELPFELAGGREKRYSPEDVLDAAVRYKRVPVREVAAALVALANQKNTSAAAPLEHRVDHYLEQRASERPDADRLIAQLGSLPPGLAKQIREHLNAQRPTRRARKARASTAGTPTVKGVRRAQA